MRPMGFPATVIVDREGKVLLTQAGVPTVSQIRKLLNRKPR